MKNSLTRIEAWQILNEYITKPELILHMRESEEIMRALAIYFQEDEELWGNTGLLHDLDMQICSEDYQDHGEKTIELLIKHGYEIPEMFAAIRAHTEILNHSAHRRKTRLDYALAAAENISGFIVAVALMRPGKLEDMKIKSIKKKLKDKTFAAKVSREFVQDIEKTGLSQDEFLHIALDALKKIKSEIGF
jgi:predicted hydrolase (HD superfamily)